MASERVAALQRRPARRRVCRTVPAGTLCAMTGAGGDRPARERASPARRNRGALWLLVLPFLALMVPPLYAHVTPRIFGIPFFYWYQAVWLIVTAAITTFVYRLRR